MLNRITIQGRLTRDPELRKTPGGKSVTTITLACERDVKEQGERKADFIDVVAWNQTAEFVCNYLRKGYMAIAEGRLQLRDYQDRSGNNRKATEIQAVNVYSAESKRPVTQEDATGGLHTDDQYEPSDSWPY